MALLLDENVIRPVVRALDLVNRKGKSLAVRLVKWTGKAPYPIHPKHLIDAPWHHWYVRYVRSTDRVLDLGCGHGAHALAVAPHVRSVIGVDRDPRALDIARGLSAPLNVETREGDIERPLPFPSRYFDAVLCLDVIEHLHARQAMLREVHRVLRPGGRLLISAPNRDTAWRRTLRDAGLFAYSDPDHKVEYSREDFAAELARGGFGYESASMPVVYDTPWAGMIDATGGLSLTLYARLSQWKRNKALQYPTESTGFRVVARPV